ncbi:hypothetical protein STAQ_27880 [Allostella sp. ATCC 35155]|nr:hypothetical protein STAQ_27880 [Stella sp. ATCC 35155]
MRFHVSIQLALVAEPTGVHVLGIPGSAIAVAHLAPGMTIEAADAQILARAWVHRRGETLSPAEVDQLLARGR